MLYSSCVEITLPKEYRKAAKDLFPEEDIPPAEKSVIKNDSFPQGSLSQQAVIAFAEKLGVETDYRKITGDWEDIGELEKFLHSFRNNLELLIQKTWVEKDDEDRKEKLLDRVPGLITFIKEKNYALALGEFGAILDELAWLLFGAQSREKDFFDYVFRIDHQFGLFWWYGGQLEHFLSEGQKDEESLKTLLLLGLCYLTEF